MEVPVAVLLLDPKSTSLNPLISRRYRRNFSKPIKPIRPLRRLSIGLDVRKDHAGRCRFTVIEMKKTSSGSRIGITLLLNVPHLIIGQGDETPVTRPGVIEYLLDQIKLRVHFLWTKAPDVDPSSFGDRSARRSIHSEAGIAIDQEGQQILLLVKPQRFGPALGSTGECTASSRQRIIKSLNEPIPSRCSSTG